MSIDWSKAPDGATHAGIIPSRNTSVKWYRDIDPVRGRYEYFSLMDESWHISGGSPLAQELIPRPAESAPAALTWDGQGLPPVGAEVEANFPVTDTTGTHYHWRRVIVAVAGIPGAERECLVYDAENTKPAWVDELRHIRTPEQIAAEERRNSILHLANLLIDSRGHCNEYSQAKAIFDAGYRRQESST
ncbi:hypothetical protein RJ634_005990 [Pseudomonas aeruginosa]|nr:hypothetical protein [Pseudomonas aeruginosa]